MQMPRILPLFYLKIYTLWNRVDNKPTLEWNSTETLRTVLCRPLRIRNVTTCFEFGGNFITSFVELTYVEYNVLVIFQNKVCQLCKDVIQNIIVNYF